MAKRSNLKILSYHRNIYNNSNTIKIKPSCTLAYHYSVFQSEKEFRWKTNFEKFLKLDIIVTEKATRMNTKLVWRKGRIKEDI